MASRAARAASARGHATAANMARRPCFSSASSPMSAPCLPQSPDVPPGKAPWLPSGKYTKNMKKRTGNHHAVFPWVNQQINYFYGPFVNGCDFGPSGFINGKFHLHPWFLDGVFRHRQMVNIGGRLWTSFFGNIQLFLCAQCWTWNGCGSKQLKIAATSIVATIRGEISSYAQSTLCTKR